MKKTVVAALAALASFGTFLSAPVKAQPTPTLTPETKIVEVKNFVTALGLSEGVVMMPTGHYTIRTFDLQGKQLGELPCAHAVGGSYPVFDKSGVAAIVRNDTGTKEVCLVNKTGKVIKSFPQFKGAPIIWDGFVDGIAAVGHRWLHVNYVNKNGLLVNKAAEQNIRSQLEIMYNDPHFDQTAYPLAEGRRLFYDYYANTYGFLDATGNVAIKASYVLAESFSDGVALILTDGTGGFNWGYIDKNGKEVIKPRYGIRPGSFHEGKAVMNSRGRRSYFINKQGEKISPAYLEAWRFFHGYAIVITEENPGALTIIDNEFNPVGPLAEVADDIVYNDKEGIFYTTQTVYAPNGEILFMIPPKDGKLLSGFINGLAAAYYKGELGLVNKKGEFTLVFREATN